MFSKFISDLKREFSGYNAKKLMNDLMAGLTVCAVALPLALAFGVSSGVSAAAGLVTAILAGIVIGLVSGASYQISGPTGAMSAVLIGIVAKYGLQGVFIACLGAGIILLICGLLKMGRLISFIPMPVIMGFTSGIAIIIALGQVDNFFGTVSEGTSAISKLMSYGTLGFNPNMQSVAIGVFVVLIMILWPKKWASKVPGSLISIITATILATVLGFDEIALVGDIPKTLFMEDRLQLSAFNFKMLSDLLSPIITIAALGMIESLLCGASAARMTSEKFDADRELVAQGIGNILIPFFGGVPATAAIARTSVAIKSGEQTRLTSVFHSVFLLLSMFVLGGVMAKLPISALAGVLMVTAWRMNEWSGIKYIFSHKFKSAISQFLITMVATVVFDLTTAILIGVIYSAILYVASSGHLNVEFSSVDVERLPSQSYGEGIQRAVVAYITGSVFFGAVDSLHNSFENMPECEHLILSMRGVPNIDVSGAQEVLLLCRSCHENGKTVVFCGVCPEVRRYLDRAGVTEVVGEAAFYWSADKALSDLFASQRAVSI